MRAAVFEALASFDKPASAYDVAGAGFEGTKGGG